MQLKIETIILAAALAATFASAAPVGSDAPTPVPGFSIAYMDRSVSPATNFYEFADGQWAKDNPVPPDKSRWGGFAELAERNWYLIHDLLQRAETDASAPLHSPEREVGDFFASAMDTNRLEQLGFQPIADDLARIKHIHSRKAITGFSNHRWIAIAITEVSASSPRISAASAGDGSAVACGNTFRSTVKTMYGWTR